MSCNTVSGSSNLICDKCNGIYKIEKYFLAHIRKCNKVKSAGDNSRPNTLLTTTTTTTSTNNCLPVKDIVLSQTSAPYETNSGSHPTTIPSTYIWEKLDPSAFEYDISNAYENIVYWKKNMFLLPSGKSGNDFIDEMTTLICESNNNSPVKPIALKALMVIPCLLLKKPSRTSKAKDHLTAFERRLTLWKDGDIKELVHEAETIENQLLFNGNKTSIADISNSFRNFIMKGEINSALRLLSDNMQNGILPLDTKTLNLLKKKHPPPENPDPSLSFKDSPEKVHPIRFESITAESIKTAAAKTKGGSGSGGLDAVGWRRILTAKSFGKSSDDLCTAIALMSRKLCRDTLLSGPRHKKDKTGN
eukprot:gene836-131_t